VPAQVAEQFPGGCVVLHAAGLPHDLRIDLAHRAGAVETGEQDPNLGGVEWRWLLISLL
jgi:hypothetical protein